MKKRNKKDPFYQVHKIENDFKSHAIEWSATTLSLVGAVLNAKQLIAGFIFWIVANVLWILFAYKNRHWGLLFMNFIFMLINLFGIYTWLGL